MYFPKMLMAENDESGSFTKRQLFNRSWQSLHGPVFPAGSKNHHLRLRRESLQRGGKILATKFLVTLVDKLRHIVITQVNLASVRYIQRSYLVITKHPRLSDHVPDI